VVLRRGLLIALLAALAAGAGLAARDLRDARADHAKSDQASDELTSGVGAASSATPVPKWSTRRLQLPAEIGAWSIRISPDGNALAGVLAQPPGVGVCTAVDKVSPPTCRPPVPSRVFLYRVNDAPGEITATLTKIAEVPENGGVGWLPDGGLLVASLDTAPTSKISGKTVSVTLVERDGRTVALGSLEGGGMPSVAASPDGKWLAAAQSQPPAITFIDRKTASSRSVPADGGGPAVPIGWSVDGRVLVGNGSTLLRVSPDGAIDRIPGPDGARLAGVVSVSPDGSLAVFRANRPQVEGLSVLVGARWVDVPREAQRTAFPTWLTARELLLRSDAGALQAWDPRTGATRDLRFTMRVTDPRILAYSEPYLVWRDGDAGRLHLLDTRSAYDVIVGTTAVMGVQPYAAGGFLLLHQDGAELLTGADFFARVPPTTAPFVSAAPPKPGTKDPFVDIKALPRLDQFASGGPLEVVSRDAATKRVRSQEGGWSLEVPTDWRADAGRLRGGELYSFDPTGRDFSGNAPAPGEVRMSITLWPDFDHRGPAWFAENQSRPGRVTDKQITSVTIAGRAAYRVVTHEEQPTSFSPIVARWYVPHPSFDDRIIEVILFRADDTALPQAERVLATLQLTEPVSGPRAPLLTRREAIERMASSGPKPTASPASPDRIEAKLVTQKELELAQASGGGYSLDADTPVWVVVRSGAIEPVIRGGPVGFVAPTALWGWRFSVLDARTGQGFAGGGGGTPGTEPPWWPSLRDRATGP